MVLGKISQASDDYDFMPDALDIVRQVLDDLQESNEDKMDIDSGSGHGAR